MAADVITAVLYAFALVGALCVTFTAAIAAGVCAGSRAARREKRASARRLHPALRALEHDLSGIRADDIAALYPAPKEQQL